MPAPPLPPKKTSAIAFWLPGAAGAVVSGLVTWLAAGLGAGAPLTGVGVGAIVAVAVAMFARGVVARGLADRARRLDRELGDQPPGALRARRAPEDVVDQIYARQEARLLLVKEAVRASADAARGEQRAAIVALERERDEHRAALGDARAENARLRARGAFLESTLELPLAAVIGATDLVLDGELGAEQQRLLKLARGTTATAAAALGRYGERAEGEETSVSRSFSPRRNVVQTLRRVAAEAERRGVELVARFTGGVPSRAEADSPRLESVLVTLVGWALARSRSSCVTVNVGVATGDAARGGETALLVTVEDTGPPLDETASAALFTATEPGSDLALSMARALVAEVGGDAWVESSTFMATRLAFTFPVQRRKRVTATTLYGRGAVTDKTVLVVDDQPGSRTVLSELLAGWRLLPTAVASSSAALSALRSAARGGEPFDLVLVDRHLGDEDGLQLVRTVAGERGLGPQRVILLDQLADLARPLPEDVRPLVAGRALKPILPEELIEVFTAVLAPPRTAPRVHTRRGVRPDPDKRPVKVLVAEDNPVNQIFVARLLEKRGHHVTLANNGADVIDCLDTTPEPFDVILMDIQMPVLDGLEATGIIRERERRAGVGHLPIIAVTAHVMPGEEQRVLDAGLDAYVPKPVQEERLFDAIERLLPEGFDALGPRELPRADGGPPASVPVAVAEVAEAPEAKVFDEAKVLSFVADDAEFLQSLVELFIETSPKQITAIGEAIASADPVALERSAHQLKGSVGNFGAERARHWAYRLEKAGRAKTLEGVEEAFGKLTGEVETLRHALRDLAVRQAAAP